ncbi:hypothetical protein [Geopsychrobacter electrodiphilus]|uniref:hypothetical protein n=1 Tax=Geopsychrobacter electrodiphilus TaxID=225196 RepID=UPI00036282C3|nr:hypothetical protein [Geopsychrobacter electrodiphilus]
MTEVLLRKVEINKSLTLEFYDLSNRYFGDYYRVLIEIEALPASPCGVLRLRYQRPLKKMGVAGAEVELQKERLIDQFLQTTAQYMGQPGFVQQLLVAMSKSDQRLWKHI